MSLSGRRGARVLAVAAILALVTAAPVSGSQGDPPDSEPVGAGVVLGEIGAKTLDAVLLRPLGAVATVAGFAFFVVASPLAAASLDIGASWDAFVLAPADYTFRRPLGDF